MSGGSPSSVVRALATSAMIGTDRSEPGAGGAAKLLSQASVAGAKARAGFRALKVTGDAEVCPGDERRVAPGAAGATLMRLLADSDAGLIEEWAELARRRRVRVAELTAPVLLEWWARQPRRPDAVFAVLGKRGEWLVSLNPAWRKPVAGEDIPSNAQEIWETGKAPERAAVLLTIRRHDPERARKLVESTWASDGADERRRFVEVLAERVSMADEPFLESALDDKSKVVRRAAAGVLGMLEGSRYRARMNERARACIVAEEKRGLLKRGAKVTLSPPQEFEKAWERDGIEEQAAGGMGKRAWWMRQILSGADLSVWTEATGQDPEGVLKALAEDDYRGIAVMAMVDATRERGDAAWAAALLRHLLEGKKVETGELAALWANVDERARGKLILEAAGHSRFGGVDRWEILASAGGRWTVEFSQAALRLLGEKKVAKVYSWGLYEPVDRVSRMIAPALAEEFAETVLGMFPEEPTESFKKSIDRVRLRADMHKELSA